MQEQRRSKHEKKPSKKKLKNIKIQDKCQDPDWHFGNNEVDLTSGDVGDDRNFGTLSFPVSVSQVNHPSTLLTSLLMTAGVTTRAVQRKRLEDNKSKIRELTTRSDTYIETVGNQIKSLTDQRAKLVESCRIIRKQANGRNTHILKLELDGNLKKIYGIDTNLKELKAQREIVEKNSEKLKKQEYISEFKSIMTDFTGLMKENRTLEKQTQQDLSSIATDVLEEEGEDEDDAEFFAEMSISKTTNGDENDLSYLIKEMDDLDAEDTVNTLETLPKMPEITPRKPKNQGKGSGHQLLAIPPTTYVFDVDNEIDKEYRIEAQEEEEEEEEEEKEQEGGTKGKLENLPGSNLLNKQADVNRDIMIKVTKNKNKGKRTDPPLNS